MLIFCGNIYAEGTKQLEPVDAPLKSACKIALTQNSSENRIPFALLNCEEGYRLNIRISDFASEKIYLGLGNVQDYFDETIIYTDVNYQVKDPAGNIVAGYALNVVPYQPGTAGFIESLDEAYSGPNINNTNPAGYNPLVISPAMNGDYILEFEIPELGETEARIFKYIDATVAKGSTPVNGRLWSKAWQLSSASVNSEDHATYSLFYVYSNDSIVTRFDCNGLAGGIWAIYSNEWGCATSGTWSDRRHSIIGNASVQPEYKIFLNDPDLSEFPSGLIGEMKEFNVLPFECDTVITFWANLSKGGNIEIVLDIPPLNPNFFGPEDVQLGYSVAAGPNILLPAWDGKNGFGIPLTNGTQVEARIRFLNGLSNIPLYDVEDNPKGFKVDIQRPLPATGSTKLKLYWDDTWLPPDCYPTSNVIEGCEYTGLEPVTGCHDWSFINSYLGDVNTINSWWFLTTNDALIIPITLKLSPSAGHIAGPVNICAGQLVTFRTTSIPFAQKYIWHLSGPGISIDVEKDSPDTTFTQQFSTYMVQGSYTISVFGRNPQCGDGDSAFHASWVYDNLPPPVNGESSVCVNSQYQYQVSGLYTNIHWNTKSGNIIGSPDKNPVTINWATAGIDTIQVLATSVDCGTRLSVIVVEVNPAATVEFDISGEATACPGLPLSFSDRSGINSGSVISRYWDWGDGLNSDGNDSIVEHSFSGTGTFPVVLKVTTDHGCKSVANHLVTIIPYPEASFACYSNCLNQSIQLSDNSTGINLISRTWDFGSAPVTSDNLNMQQPEAVFHATGEFPVRLVVTNNYGCIDTVIKQVTIHNIPEADFVYENPCQGTGVSFSEKSIPADTLLNQFSWNVKSSSGDERTYYGNPGFILFKDAADYTVRLLATDAFGCFDTVSSVITVKPQPDCSFGYLENINNIKGKLHFENYTSGASEYFWDFGNLITSALTEPDITYNLEGKYTIRLIATSIDGCTDTATRQYYYMPGLWMPNAFSPDNDGLNDIFRPVTQRNTLEPYSLLIFNNWGQLIFRSTNPDKGWDGMFDGEPCPAGDYTYILQFREAKNDVPETVTQRGIVCLIR
jgi:gliding motility-associated-like protein